MTEDSADLPALRVGDRERRAADDRLLAAVGDGVLTLQEYDERAAGLWQARTRADLDLLTADLPAAAMPVRRSSTGQVRARHVVAVMSQDRFDAPLLPGQGVNSYAVMGSTVLDLRRDDLPEHVRITAWAVMGDVEVLVPPDATVHLSGLSFMGDRKVGVRGGAGSVVSVHAVAVMGSVHVHAGDGRMLPAGGSTTQPGDRAPTGTSLDRQAPGQREAGADRPVRRESAGRGLVGGLGRGLGALVLPAALIGGLVLAGPDGASVFGSQEVRVGQTQQEAKVSVLFGSVEVVVPDDVRVDPAGFTLFGSVNCKQACSTTDKPGGVVRVRSVGAFGSVSIKTESEAAASKKD